VIVRKENPAAGTPYAYAGGMIANRKYAVSRMVGVIPGVASGGIRGDHEIGRRVT